MNNALILLIFFVTSLTAGLTAEAYTRDQQLQWGDLDVGTKYHLISDIKFPEGVTLPQDSGLLLIEIQGGLGIVNFIFQNLTCTDYSLKTELVMFNPDPEDTTIDKSIGVELQNTCVVSMWVEAKNYYEIGALAR